MKIYSAVCVGDNVYERCGERDGERTDKWSKFWVHIICSNASYTCSRIPPAYVCNTARSGAMVQEEEVLGVWEELRAILVSLIQFGLLGLVLPKVLP